MSKFAVTLADLRKAGACFSGYNKVVRMLQGRPFTAADAERDSYIRLAHKAPISLADIARNNGLDDALWSLRCVSNADRDMRLFAVWCARQVEHLMPDERSRAALNVAERFANGCATVEELDAAARAAYAAYAAYAAADAAYAAYAARAAYAAAAAHVARAARAAYAAYAAHAAYAAANAVRADQLEMFIDMCNGEAFWQS